MKIRHLHKFRIFMLILLVIHWIIPLELPMLGQGSGGMFRAGLYLLLFVSLFVNIGLFRMNRILMAFILSYFLFFFLRFLSPLCWGRELEWKMCYLWIPMFLLLLTVTCTSYKDIRLLFIVFLSAIALSVIYGILMVHVGEPFLSLRNILISVDEMESDRMELHEFRNIGFASSIFAMGYQIAVLICSLLLAYLITKNRKAKLYYMLLLLVLVVGIVDNAERASIVGILVGVTVGVFRLKLMSVKLYASVACLIVAIFIIFACGIISPQGNERRGNLLMRMQDEQLDDDNYIRLERQIIGFVSIFSITESPEVTYEKKCYSNIGNSEVAPHNHYVTVGLDGFWVFFMELFLLTVIYMIYRIGRNKLRKYFRKEYILHVVIFSALVAEATTSLFHNNGIFSTEPAGIILLGFLCSSTHNAYRLQKRKIIVQYETK